MNAKNILHQIKIRRPDFLDLVEDFPDKADLLNSISDFLGPKAVINLTPQNEEELGKELVNHLYRLAHGLNEKRFLSYFYQLNEILNLPRDKVHNIIEIGQGNKIFAALIKNYGYNLVTIDIDLHWNPDIQGNILNISVKLKAVDLVCAFEVLEHLPHKYFQQAIREMARCANHYLYISLPCQTNSLYLYFNLRFLEPFFKRFSFGFNIFHTLPTRIPDSDENKLLRRKDKHNPHYWEVSRRSFPKKKILEEIENCNLAVIREFHNPFHPYHYFILCEMKKDIINRKGDQ